VLNPNFNFCKRDDGLDEVFEDGGNESKSGNASSSHSAFSWVEADETGVVPTV
jgi:hypothetical protein